MQMVHNAGIKAVSLVYAVWQRR